MNHGPVRSRPAPPASVGDWSERLRRLQFQERLEQARGRVTPAATQQAIAGYSRRSVRFLARVLLRLSRGITLPQRLFNEAILDLQEGLFGELKREHEQRATELAALRDRCLRLEARLERCEQRTSAAI